MPSRPSSPISVATSFGKTPRSNQSSMPGSTRERTKSRTVSRIRRSSSESSDSTSRKSEGSRRSADPRVAVLPRLSGARAEDRSLASRHGTPPATDRTRQAAQNDWPVDAIFEPRSVAVYGASRDEAKLGHTLLRNVLTGGF